MKRSAILILTLFPALLWGQMKPEKQNDLPLKPGRTFEITTSVGTWMSLDASPDGSTLAFDFLGDLYTMPISGGTPKRITEGMAYDGQPRFSPDGKKLVYVSDKSGGEGVWIVDLESLEEKQITSGKSDRYQSPEWSPDGEYIFASKAGMRSGTIKIWMYHVDGGTGVKLMEEPDNRKMTGVAFGNNDQYIWFAQRTGDWQYNAILPQYQIGRYDRETGKSETMTFRQGSAFRPTLSPDGNWLVYATRYEAETGLVLRNLKTFEEKWLAYPVQHDDQESRATRDAYPGMSFSPDSKFVYATWSGKIWKVAIDGSGATEVPFELSTSIEMGAELSFDYPIEDSKTFVVKQIRNAVPSPEGDKIVFASLDKIYTADIDGGNPRKLTKNNFNEAFPVWSPDGQWVAFVSWNGSEGHIMKARVSGRKAGETIQLTKEPALYEQIAWSPNGQRIVAMKGPAVNFQTAINQRAPGTGREIVWVDQNGGDTQFVEYSYGRNNPHFSANANRIYLNKRGGTLVSIRWDGTDEKEIVKIEGSSAPGSRRPDTASEIFISKDEKSAIALVYKDIYHVIIPKVGGETPKINVSKGDKAAFPAKKLSDIGGEFLHYASKHQKAYWSIGNAFVTYDLSESDKMENLKRDYLKSLPDSVKKSKKDTLEYEPLEIRVKVNANRDIPTGFSVYKNARIITMKGDELFESGTIVVEDNRIVYVGVDSGAPETKNAKILDMAGKTIIPGFVDTHAHVRPAWGIHKQQAWQFYANLAYGVTTVRDPQTSSTDILTYEDQVKAGNMIGPRIYSTGPGMFWNEQVKDLDHARKLVKRYSEYYDTKTIKMYVAGNRQQRQWILMACKEQEIMPTTEGSLNFLQNLTQIIDGYPGHEHSFPVFPLYDDAVKMIAFSKTAYTPTLLVAYGGPWAENYYYTRENPHGNEKLRYFTPHAEIDAKTRRRGMGTGPGPGGWFMDEEHVFVKQAAQLKKIVDAGGRAGVGSHGQLQGLGYHWELWSVQSGGISNHEALRIATIHGAEAIGLDKDLGTIEKGKLADFVIFDKNPLENIRNTNSILYVVKNGRIYEGSTLNEIFPLQRKAEVSAWSDEKPENLPGTNK